MIKINNMKKKFNTLKKSKYFKVLTITITMLLIFLSTSIIGFANETVNHDVVYEGGSYIGNYKMGNTLSNIHNYKSTEIVIGKGSLFNDSIIYVSDNNIIYKYYEKGLLGIKKKVEVTLLENVDAKNLNILDSSNSHLDDTVYFTDNGKVKWVNIQSLNSGTIDELKGKYVKMMYLINNEHLFCMCDSEIIKYSLSTGCIESIDMVDYTISFIPTEYGMINFTNDFKILNAFVNNKSIRALLVSMYEGRKYKKFSVLNVTRNSFKFLLELEETDIDIPRELHYEISLKDLFDPNLDSSFFKKVKDSELDNIYSYNGDINFFEKPGHYICDNKLGNSYENVIKSTNKTDFGDGSSIYISGYDIIYRYPNGTSITLIRDKSVTEPNFYQDGSNAYLFYKSNNKLKKLDLNTGEKTFVEPLQGKDISDIYIVNDSLLYYVENNKIYTYDISSEEITEICDNEYKYDYIPTPYGIIFITSRDLLVNNEYVLDTFKELMSFDFDYSLEYEFNENDLVINVSDANQLRYIYNISYDNMFNNLSEESFVLIEEIDTPEDNADEEYDNVDENFDNEGDELDNTDESFDNMDENLDNDNADIMEDNSEPVLAEYDKSKVRYYLEKVHAQYYYKIAKMYTPINNIMFNEGKYSYYITDTDYISYKDKNIILTYNDNGVKKYMVLYSYDNNEIITNLTCYKCTYCYIYYLENGKLVSLDPLTKEKKYVQVPDSNIQCFYLYECGDMIYKTKNSIKYYDLATDLRRGLNVNIPLLEDENIINVIPRFREGPIVDSHGSECGKRLRINLITFKEDTMTYTKRRSDENVTYDGNIIEKHDFEITVVGEGSTYTIKNKTYNSKNLMNDFFDRVNREYTSKHNVKSIDDFNIDKENLYFTIEFEENSEGSYDKIKVKSDLDQLCMTGSDTGLYAYKVTE